MRISVELVGPEFSLRGSQPLPLPNLEPKWHSNEKFFKLGEGCSRVYELDILHLRLIELHRGPFVDLTFSDASASKPVMSVVPVSGAG